MRDVRFVGHIDGVEDEREVEILGWSLFPDDYLPPRGGRLYAM